MGGLDCVRVRWSRVVRMGRLVASLYVGRRIEIWGGGSAVGAIVEGIRERDWRDSENGEPMRVKTEN